MNYKTTASIALLVILFLTVSIPVSQGLPPIYQDTIIVDIDGNGDYTSIKKAVENADSLTNVKVKAGVYHENSFVINKKIALTGEDPKNTIIDFDGSTGIIVNNSYIEIHNLQIIDTVEYSITVSFEKDNCNLSNLIISPRNAHGIILQSAKTNIDNCKISSDETSGQGIKVRGDYNTIDRCNVHGFGEGIMFLINSNNNLLSNCYSYGNDVGIDIRINSMNNKIKNCNIYGNEYGIYIWQNSNQNQIHQNNFWKNDIDAVDKNNNLWYINNEGNFWDDYTGLDSNDDGIGDSPYKISNNVEDRYPLISMVLPNKISAPSSIELLSNRWDNTPIFSWEESLYKEGVKGYYVRIDEGEEQFVKDTTFTVENSLSNGAHTIYVRAEGNDGKISSISSYSFSIDTTFIDSDSDGWSDNEEKKYGTDPENPDNYPLDTDGDGVPDEYDDDSDGDGYPDEMEKSYNTNPKNSEDYPLDTDDDGVPDEDSADGRYAGDLDDDDDYLSDNVEINLGSDPKDSTDVKKIYLKGNPYYLVDTTNNNEYNILYNPETKTTTEVKKQENNYLIDENGDENYEYIYLSSENRVDTYQSEWIKLDIDPLVIFNIILLSVAVILIIYYLKTRKSDKSEIEEKHISKKQPQINIAKEENMQMFGLTKNLLENMQKEISVYMEQLNRIENQITKGKTDDSKQKSVMKTMDDTKYQIKEKNNEIETEEKTFKLEEKEIKTVKTIEEKIDELIENNNL